MRTVDYSNPLTQEHYLTTPPLKNITYMEKNHSGRAMFAGITYKWCHEARVHYKKIYQELFM